MIGIVGLAFLGSIGLSKWYWGYFFKRPGLLNAAKTITKVERVIPVKTASCDTPDQCEFIVDGSNTLDQSLNHTQQDPYYSLIERILVHLQARGALPNSFRQDPYYSLSERILLHLQARRMLPNSFSQDLDGIAALYAALMQTPIIADPDPGYFDAHQLQGIVLIGATVHGEQRVFVGAKGRQLSNDHYPYYEAVFKIEADGETVTYLNGQRFFFDVAGIEGFEWYAFWLVLTVFGIALVFPVVGIGALIYQRQFNRAQIDQ